MNGEMEGHKQDSVILEQIKAVLGVDFWARDQKREKFIRDRLATLISTTKPTEIPPYTGVYENFIHPDSVIKVSRVLIGFRLDDPTIYNDLMGRIAGLIKSKKAISSQIPQLVTDTTSFYLMSLYKLGGAQAKRDTYYEIQTKMLGENFRGDSSFSIKELAGHGMAVCAEHSTVAHNLLMFLGETSVFMTGNDCQIPLGTTHRRHAYNIVRKTPYQALLFDPTNPLDDDFTAAVYPLGAAEFKSLLEGGEVMVGRGEDRRLYQGPAYPKEHREFLKRVERLQKQQ